MAEGGKDAQADQRIGVATRRAGILGHLHHHRRDELADGQDRLDGIGATRLHKAAPGVARHDLLHIPAQGEAGDAVLLGEAGKIGGCSQTHAVACLLQAATQGDTGLDVAA